MEVQNGRKQKLQGPKSTAKDENTQIQKDRRERMDRETAVQTYRSIEETYASYIQRNEQRRDIYKRYKTQKG